MEGPADGRRALSGSEDGHLRFWDLETGSGLSWLKVETGGSARSLFSRMVGG